MERISFIVDRLNMPPFSKGYATMTEIDSKTAIELLDLTCEIVVAIDKDQSSNLQDQPETRLQAIMDFLRVMKFSSPPNVTIEQLQSYLSSGDKEAWHIVIHWLLHKFEHLQKRAYLAKYLMPIDIPAEFQGEPLIIELQGHLVELQADFKEIHKAVDQLRVSGAKPGEIKSEIIQIETEIKQLNKKIKKMQENIKPDDDEDFKRMLKVTSSLRKEQEEELRVYDRLRTYRQGLDEADLRLNDAKKRLAEMRSSGIQNQSADQLLSKLQKDVRELNNRRENLENALSEREMHLEKLSGFDQAMTEDDVRAKRDQLHDLEDAVAHLTDRLSAALERNPKLEVFSKASSAAMKKLREKEDEVERLMDEKRRLRKLIEDKDSELKSSGTKITKIGKKEYERFEASIKVKLEGYKRMREEMAAIKAELVVLQKTEQLLKDKNVNLDEFLADLEKKKGVKGFRNTQRALVEMTEKAAEVDQMKGATLEDMSSLVNEIMRVLNQKKRDLEPLIRQLQETKQEQAKIESVYSEAKTHYEKAAIALDIEKQQLEKDCDQCQEEYLLEESRYHTLASLISIAKVKLDRAEKEKKFRQGEDSLLRDIKSLKELYAQKSNQQENLIKTLRKKQKDLKENSVLMSHQKTHFNNLFTLLNAKQRSVLGIDGSVGVSSSAFGGANVMSFTD